MMRASRPSSANAEAGLSGRATSSDTIAVRIGDPNDNRSSPPETRCLLHGALRVVSALREEQVGVAHVDDGAQGLALVHRAGVERLGNSISNEVAEVARAVSGRAALIVE